MKGSVHDIYYLEVSSTRQLKCIFLTYPLDYPPRDTSMFIPGNSLSIVIYQVQVLEVDCEECRKVS